MKTTMRHTALAIMAALLPMMTACVKDDVATQQADKVDLTLHFSTRADSQTEDVATAKGEGIKTLRVIITDSESQKVIANIWKDYSVEKPLAISKTLNILGMPTGTRDFYVVINEKSVGMDTYLSGITEGGKLPTDFLTKQVINTTENAWFPKRLVLTSLIDSPGIPATGFKKNVVLSADSPNTVEIECTHAVAKVVIDLDNTEMDESYVIRKINWGAFFTDRTSLFPGQAPLTGLEYQQKSDTYWSSDVFVEANQMYKDYYTVYLFETGDMRSNAAFTLALESETVTELKEPKNFFSTATVPVTEIKRNTVVRINAKVKVHKEVEVSLSYQVLPWDETSVTVPPFN